MKKDERVDAYIARQADFARPILIHLRETVHAACPACDETLKWSMPSFLYRGKILAGMAAFKGHATFGFWGHAEVAGDAAKGGGMGQFGRLNSVADLPPPSDLQDMIAKVMERIDAGGTKRPKKPAKPPPAMPADLKAALAGNADAHATFSSFPPSAQKEYLEWITEAKRPETRAKRLAQAVDWMAEGKRRNWKYENC